MTAVTRLGSGVATHPEAVGEGEGNGRVEVLGRAWSAAFLPLQRESLRAGPEALRRSDGEAA